MQTFLPFPDYTMSARVLDQKRLGKQRVETMQIMKALALHEGPISIQKHWVTDLWRGYEHSLLEYQHAICWQWHRVLGFEDTCLKKTINLFQANPIFMGDVECGEISEPWWLGNPDYHYAMKSNLIRKKPEYYTSIFPGVPDDLPYLDPNKLGLET